jgi:hypothetical protein
MPALPHFLRDPAPAEAAVRLLFTPPGGGEPLSLWATPAGGAFVLAVDAPGLAPGWVVSGRGVSGTVSAVNGRAVEVTP